MFSRIYGFLRGRLGDAVDAFMDGCLEEVSRQYGALFDGVDLKHYGRADFEQMLANVADLPAEQRKSLMVSALNELVYVIQLAVRTRARRAGGGRGVRHHQGRAAEARGGLSDGRAAS